MGKKMTGDFMVDYVEETDTTAFTAFRDDRSVTIEIKPLCGDPTPDQITGHETSIAYGLLTPSISRRRDGYRGSWANEIVERAVPDARIEDVIMALQWLIGTGEIGANAVERRTPGQER